jgi:hypothetical protein
MKNKIFGGVVLVSLCVVITAGHFLQEDRVIPVEKISNDIVTKAGINGKYKDLIYVLKVPEDKASYGEFNDYGYWGGGAWAGVKDNPAGYWVFVDPYWLVFKTKSQSGENDRIIPLDKLPKDFSSKASVNGKYSDPFYVLKVPEDKKSYGDFYDWGYWGGGSWAGVKDNPAGYWVFVEPYWIVFRSKGAAGSGPSRAILEKFKGEKIRIIHEETSSSSAVVVYRLENGSIKYCMDKLTKDGDTWKISSQHGCSIVLSEKSGAGTPDRVIPVKDIPNDVVEKGTVKGKYSDLIYVLKVPEDKASYGEFNDYGWWGGGAWAGVKDNPAGYWVYVDPYWLVFKTKK